MAEEPSRCKHETEPEGVDQMRRNLYKHVSEGNIE